MSEYQPQKLIVYNKHLPYQIQDEAVSKIAEIKYNLARAVIFQEISPGISLWCNRLIVYLRLHGRNFSKEDHVLFIKLFYHLVTMPGMEPQFVKTFAILLHKLIKKKELLSRDDLQLPWKPLYELVKSIRYSKLAPIGLEKFPSKYLDTVIHVVRFARSYFTVDSTEEMLLEFRPLMCPLDTTKTNAAFYFTTFLPTQIPQENKDQSYGLWLEEFLEYWFHCTQNIQNVSEDFVLLFTRLAEGNVGYINWTPYITRIFDILLSNLNLPVNGKRAKFYMDRKGFQGTFAKWIVFMLGGEHGTVAMDHLEKLFVALKSFYHPSNHGKHSFILLGFLKILVDNLVKRLNHERFHEPSWMTFIPEHVRITDEEIKRFVTIVKDVALLSVFSKTGSIQAASILQNLALLRADLILPSLLDRTFEALETLVEPHQVTATLSCITSVARVLVTGGDHMPSAPTNILPLFRLVLPGIDPNDFRKSMCAFTFISAMASLIPIVDCTPALHAGVEMSEIEKELCLASGQFEDVVLQFMDRCFVLVENSTTESISEMDTLLGNATNFQESIISMGITSTVQTVLMQCSTKIFKSALDCLFSFVSTRVLEVKVAGKMVSDMCRAAARSRPEIALAKLLPYITNCVKNLASVDGVKNEEHVDPELLWYLEMVSQMVKCNGESLLPYKDVLKEVLRLTLHLKCKKAYSRSAKLLRSLLAALTEMYTLEWRSSHESFDQLPAEHFYIRDWGRPDDLHNLNAKWHITTPAEMEFINELITEFFLPELDILEKFTAGTESLTRDELHRHLQIIGVCIYGTATLLPTWEDKKVDGLATHTLVARDRSPNVVLTDEMKAFECCITRKQVADSMHNFFEFMREKHEDDTKSFRVIFNIYDTLLLHHGVQWNEFNARWKNAGQVKKALADKLHGNKRHVRAVQIERVQLQHDMRVLDQHSAPFTYTDKMLLDDLTTMSTSDYTEVRMNAQRVLFGCLEVFDFSARAILPQLLENIKPNPNVSHEKLKGTLYILQYSRIIYLISHYWEAMLASWILIVQANQSEKPSIVNLINQLIKRIQLKYETLKIERLVDKNCIDLAEELLNTKAPVPNSQLPDTPLDGSILPTSESRTKALKYRSDKNEVNKKSFYALEGDLCKLLSDTSIHWRCAEMCVKLLNLLINSEVKSSIVAVDVYVNLLVNDSLNLRYASTKGILGVLFQNKPTFKKVLLDYSKFALKPTKDVLLSLQPGDNRPDNEWLQYQESDPIKSQEDLNNFSFVEKTHWGYQTWPKELKVYSHEQDFYSNYRSRGKLGEVESKLLDAFCNSEYLEKFFNFFSMEVKKGEDKFRHSHYSMFKGLFRNYGRILLDHSKENINNLLSENVESKHRLATEIIAGLIRGSKNWNFEDLTSMWDFVVPLLKDVFASNVMQETCRDWTMAMITATESLDPNRFHRLFNMLTDSPLNGNGGSQGDANRLFIIQNTLGQQEWRLAKTFHAFVNYLLTHLAHNFKNVRDRIGSVLSYILMGDLKYGGYTPSSSPTVEVIINHAIGDLTELCRSVLEQDYETSSSRESSKVNEDGGEIKMEVDIPQQQREQKNSTSDEDDTEVKRRDRLAKTVLAYLANNAYNLQSISKEIYRLLPVLLPLESREDDPEIVTLCRATFPAMAVKQLPPDLVHTAVDTIIQVCNYKSWNARKSGLNYLKLMIFHNLFAMEDQSIKDNLGKMLIERLKDEQVEVREIASTLLSGLVHYGYFEVTTKLLNTFYVMAKTKVKKKRHGIELSTADLEKNIKALQIKHGGVLGLSGIVLAFPYDVETWMPEVIIHLGNYLHGVQQVAATAKKTLLEFKRTHHDNWHLHRQKFTDDQLTVLTDLLISPSYYA